MATYLIVGGIALKKMIMVFTGFILLITVFFLVLISKSETHIKTDEKIELALAKSMEETKKEKEKIDKLLTKIPQKVFEQYTHKKIVIYLKPVTTLNSDNGLFTFNHNFSNKIKFFLF